MNSIATTYIAIASNISILHISCGDCQAATNTFMLPDNKLIVSRNLYQCTLAIMTSSSKVVAMRRPKLIK